jgi:MoxR-like ATPase
MQEMVGRVYIEESVLGYLLAIVGATRTESEFRTGVSVRGGLALKQAAQARALLRGRDFVVPEDISHLVVPVLAHRLSLARQGADAIEERSAIESILRRLLGHLSEPV